MEGETEIMTVAEVAEYHNVKPATVRNWAKSGVLKSTFESGSYKFDGRTVKAFKKPRRGRPSKA